MSNDDASKVTRFTSSAVTPAALFTQLPMPPSSNNQYYLARRGPKVYHIASDELKGFKASMAAYPLMRSVIFELNKNLVRNWVEQGYTLEIRSIFFFHENRLFTKKNTTKRLDCSNRIKALHDQLCNIIGIDDSLFFKVYAEKAVCLDHINEDCCTEILPIINT